VRYEYLHTGPQYSVCASYAMVLDTWSHRQRGNYERVYIGAYLILCWLSDMLQKQGYSYTPLTRSYTPLTRLLHASYTPLCWLSDIFEKQGYVREGESVWVSEMMTKTEVRLV
jgi:hypothetical protein